MSLNITLWGPEGSPYVRGVRMGLEEKGLEHQLIDLPLPDYKGEEYRSERHPFGRLPAAEVNGFRLYESQAILRLVDELSPERPIQPADPYQRARMNQMIGILNCYAWPSIGAILLNRILRPFFLNEAPIEAEVEAALPEARTSLAAMAALQSEGAFLCGDQVSIADLMFYPILQYFQQTAEGGTMLAEHPSLLAWMERMDERQSSKLLLAA
jgi:glutathione S-transferase